MNLFHGAALFAAAACLTQTADAQITQYVVKGTNARLVWESTGTPTNTINGVPVEPVDTMNWDGIGVTPIPVATVGIRVLPVLETGFVDARWMDQNGFWRYSQSAFAPPGAHGSGTVLGPSVFEHYHVQNEGIVTNVALHGDTADGAPVLPTLHCLLATWGPAAVLHNGIPYDNPFDGPAPMWIGHTMTSVGARDGTTFEVKAMDGTIYDMTKGATGFADQHDLEVHLVFHDAPMPMVAGNNPPMFSANYHLLFEDVQLAILHVD